jgi:hypothetical protein
MLLDMKSMLEHVKKDFRKRKDGFCLDEPASSVVDSSIPWHQTFRATRPVKNVLF